MRIYVHMCRRYLRFFPPDAARPYPVLRFRSLGFRVQGFCSEAGSTVTSTGLAGGSVATLNPKP